MRGMKEARETVVAVVADAKRVRATMAAHDD
jgi:hypothetical protein